ncbi:hypothetical protein PN401_05970, partial [Peptostreptococcus anaerobius]|nr:hypothetical protein [Peptostreptococcus anaerobius]
MGTAGDKNITADKTVKKDETSDNKIALKAPEKTEVADKSHLTDEEKGKVKEAVKKANKDLPETAKIEVSNEGTVIVTDGGKTGALSQEDTVFEKLKAPTPVKVKEPSKLTDDEKKAVEKAVRDANPNLPEGATIEVGNDGAVTVKDNDGKEIGKLTPAQTVKKADAIVAPAEPVEVKDPSNLTPEEKKAVEEAVKKANPTLPEGATIEVGKDGTVTVKDKDGKELGTIPAKETVKEALKAPEKPVEVKDPSKLTDDEKKAVEKAVRDANKDLPADAKVTVADDGTVTVKDKDDKPIGTIPAKETVKEALKAPKEPVEVKDPSKLTDDEKKAVEKAVRDANKDLPA